jgi:hypothetical protein
VTFIFTPSIGLLLEPLRTVSRKFPSAITVHMTPSVVVPLITTNSVPLIVVKLSVTEGNEHALGEQLVKVMVLLVETLMVLLLTPEVVSEELLET